MKIYNLLNMGNAENGSRQETHGGLKTAVMATILALTGCGKAEATDSNKAPEAGVQYASVNVETVTRAECLALRTQTDLMKACMVKLADQRKTEIAAKTEVLETEKEANDQRNTTVEVLSKKIEDRALNQDPTR